MKAALEKAEVDSLFQCYEQVSEAVDSFQRPQLDFIQLGDSLSDDRKSQMNAA